MKFLCGLSAALAGLASAVPSPSQADDKGLKVSLDLLDGTNIKATVTIPEMRHFVSARRRLSWEVLRPKKFK